MLYSRDSYISAFFYHHIFLNDSVLFLQRGDKTNWTVERPVNWWYCLCCFHFTTWPALMHFKQPFWISWACTVTLVSFFFFPSLCTLLTVWNGIWNALHYDMRTECVSWPSVHGNIRIMTHIQLSIQLFREVLHNRSMRTEWPWQALFLLTSKRGKSAEPARILCHGNNHLLCCRFSLIARKYSALGTIGLHTYTRCFIYGVHAACSHCETPQAYVNKHPGFHPLL